MLKTLRKNTKAVIWVVIISFSLWGAYSAATSLRKEGRAVGEVFGKEVTFQEFDFFYKGTQIFSPSGEAESDPEILKEKTWRNILYSREAKKQGIKAADEEVTGEVLRLLKAQGMENPSPQIYRRWAEYNFKESPRQFEEKVREFMRIQKLLRGQISKPAVPPSDEEVRKEFLLDSTTLAVEAIRYPKEDEARQAYQNSTDKKNWPKEVEKNKGRVIASKAASLREIARLAGISKENILWLNHLPAGSVSEPVPSGKDYILFKILEKQEGKGEGFEAWKKKYLENLSFQNFMMWTMELYQKAKIKDYMPRPEGNIPLGRPAPEEGPVSK